MFNLRKFHFYLGCILLVLALFYMKQYFSDCNIIKSRVQLEITGLLHDKSTEVARNLTSSEKKHFHEARVMTRKYGNEWSKYPIECQDKIVEPITAQRGKFWVFYNYIRASRTFQCHESITYTTQADFTFLDNLETLVERWRGPVSLALHAPGSDLGPTLASIHYARSCLTPLVAELVTFHIYFGEDHVPKDVPINTTVLSSEPLNCLNPAPWTNVSSADSYKTRHQILYPINVGRNIARETATTHFLLASDIELFPSRGVIPAFLKMVRRQHLSLLSPSPKVFPLYVFELEKGTPMPENKTQLVTMLNQGRAIPFHKKVCSACHNLPKLKQWIATNATADLNVFLRTKRMGPQIYWEPFYIGTHREPLYDERLSWEGRNNKMVQAYTMCVLDYNFLILKNVFLVHKPGIKIFKKDPVRGRITRQTSAVIKKNIFPELTSLFGVRKGCAISTGIGTP